MRTLLVLGAADGAVPMYVTARALGFRTICVDYKPSAPGVAFADEYLELSTRDPDEIAAAVAGRTDVVGVLAPASDAALPAQEALNRSLSLPGSISPGAVRASTDKSHFRAVCAALEFPTYRSLRVDPADSGSADAGGIADRVATQLRLPVIVKPVDSTGSRGVTLCTEPSTVAAAVRQAAGHSYSGRVVVEEYLSGSNHTVEAVIDGGRPVLVAVTDRTITPPPHFITTAHALPTTLPAATVAQVTELLAALCTELKYERGPLNLDLIVDAAGVPHLVEMGARVGGNGMAELVRHCYGVDILAASIAAATGDPITLAPTPPHPVLMHVLQAPHAGRLTSLSATGLSGWEPVRELRLFAEVGARVAPYTQAADKLGYLLIAATDRDALSPLAAEAEGRLAIQIAPDPPGTPDGRHAEAGGR